MLQVLVLLILLFSTNSYASIGKVTEEKGSAEIVRSKSKVDAKMNVGVEAMDSIQTARGVIGITFEDDTKVRVTEHSRLVIDDFVYDPKSKGAGKLAMRVALGTVRYASGGIAKENNKNVNIKTPSATVAVRGTAFTMTVDEIGQSMIILLPNADGSIGEIEVSSAAGSVTLTQAFQATHVSMSEVKPMKPVLLKLSESAIDNMLIVSPPKEIIRQLLEDNLTANDPLAFVELDRNELDVPAWKDDLSFNELNINALNSDYLTNELDYLLLNTFKVGFNAFTQVYVIDRGDKWQIDRQLTQAATILINKERGYEIILIQDRATVTVKNQDDVTNKIYIKQVSK
jgi:hypothetical protein